MTKNKIIPQKTKEDKCNSDHRRREGGRLEMSTMATLCLSQYQNYEPLQGQFTKHPA